MTTPISDEELNGIYQDAYWGERLNHDENTQYDHLYQLAGIRAIRAALQEPVSIPEYVKHVRMWRSGDGWDVFIKRIDDTYTAFSTTDPIAAIRNAVEADTP
jgi:hypothetical protein